MEQIDPIEFGKALAYLEAIKAELQDLKTRVVFRLDNLEARLEIVESHIASSKPFTDWLQKIVFGLAITATVAWTSIKLWILRK